MSRPRRRLFASSCEELEARKLLSSGYYYIVNAASGRALDGGFPASATVPVFQNRLNGEGGEYWYLDPDSIGTIKNGNNNKVLTDPGFSRTRTWMYLDPQAFPTGGAINQEWKLVKLSDGFYEIQNWWSNLVLDDPSGSVLDGTPLQQYPWNGGYNQQWILIGASTAPTYQHDVVNLAHGDVLEEPAGTAANNATDVNHASWPDSIALSRSVGVSQAADVIAIRP
jgi:endo-1,4-beta-xylanase